MSWLFLCAALHAVPEVATENPHLKRGIAQLAELNEAEALRTLEKARAWPKNTPHDLALVHLYLGLAHAGLSQAAKAVEAFRAGLLIEPELELPTDASPRIREQWVKAGGKLPEPPPQKPPEPEPAPKLEPAPAPIPQPIVVAEPPPPPPPPSRVPAFVSGATGLVLLGGGIGGLVYSLGVANQYRLQQPGGPNALSPTVSRGDAATAQTIYPVSITAMVLGVLLLGVAVMLAL